MWIPDFLDSELVVSFKSDSRVGQLAERFGIKCNCGFFKNVSGNYISYYFPLSLGGDRDGVMFLKEFNAVKEAGMYIVKLPLDNEIMSAKLFDFVKIPSMVMIAALLSGNTYKFYFLYHNSAADRISSELLGVSKQLSIRIDYMGQSRGVREILSEINREIPLMVMESTGVATDEELSQEVRCGGKEWTRILKTPMVTDELMAVYHSVDKGRGEHKSTMTEDIFECTVKNRVTKELISKDQEAGVTHLMRVHIFKNDLLTVYNVFPESFRGIPIMQLTENAERFPEWKITITGYWRLGEADY